MTIALAKSDVDITRCFPVMSQLRPHLVAEEFLPRVRRMAADKFHLAFLEADGAVRSVAGFRILDLLFSGRTLYVDDLITEASARSRGYGDKLFDWLVEHARDAGCDHFSLDSGTQRVDAHRFYLRKRMKISAFHFALALK